MAPAPATARPPPQPETHAAPGPSAAWRLHPWAPDGGLLLGATGALAGIALSLLALRAANRWGLAAAGAMVASSFGFLLLWRSGPSHRRPP